MAVRLAVLFAFTGLAGCLAAEAPSDDGALDCCGPGGPGAPEGPDEAVEFQPDALRLKRDFCTNQTLDLPAPRFGSLRLAGPEGRLYDGPMPCTVILDPARTDEERNETNVYVDIEEASASGAAFTIDSYSTALVARDTVYGSVTFVAPAGGWGDPGRYEVGYDPVEEDGRMRSMARLSLAPQD